MEQEGQRDAEKKTGHGLPEADVESAGPEGDLEEEREVAPHNDRVHRHGRHRREIDVRHLRCQQGGEQGSQAPEDDVEKPEPAPEVGDKASDEQPKYRLGKEKGQQGQGLGYADLDLPVGDGGQKDRHDGIGRRHKPRQGEIPG